MWQQNYEPVGGSLVASALVAAIPIVVLFFMLGVKRRPAWMAALAALGVALYRLAVHTGKFEIIKDSVGGLTNDRRLQALFIAFSFGAFIEGAAGFGAPVAVSGAMLAGLGFPPFELHGSGADRHPERAQLHRRDGAGAEVLEAAHYLSTGR